MENIISADERWALQSKLSLWHSAVFLVFFLIVGILLWLPVDLRLLHDSPRLPVVVGARLSLLALCVVMALVLFGLRRRLGSTALRGICIGVLVPALAMAWLSQSSYVLTGRPWPVLMSFKVAIIVVGVIDLGAVLLNGVLMAAVMIETVVFWRVFDLGSQVGRVSPNEAINVAVFFVMGGLLLWLQRSYHATSRRLFRAEEERATVEHVAKVFLSFRDLANTPLQTLEIGVARLERGEALGKKAIGSLRVALDRLNMLSRKLSGFESRITWKGHDLLSESEWTSYLGSRRKTA